MATVIDARTGKFLATLVVGTEPEGVAVSPDGRCDADRLATVVTIRVGERPWGIAIVP